MLCLAMFCLFLLCGVVAGYVTFLLAMGRHCWLWAVIAGYGPSLLAMGRHCWLWAVIAGYGPSLLAMGRHCWLWASVTFRTPAQLYENVFKKVLTFSFSIFNHVLNNNFKIW